ncbi:MAG: DUF4956 domain-containing protein [Chloroflexota bacterium]
MPPTTITEATPMTPALMFLLDLIAIGVLAFGIYFPRHHRKDMLVALVGINIGLLAVTAALASTDLSMGIGFGLFAVLSIIRLRSSEVDQQEVAYYFAALSLGLLGGVTFTPEWIGPVLMVTVLLGMFLIDHPRLFARYRVATLTLDRAWTDEPALIAHLEQLLNASVKQVKVRRVDLVEATTNVEVRYELLPTTVISPRVVPGAVEGGV